MGAVRGVENVLVGLRERIEQGLYYEAQQMYRTLHFRYSSKKRFEEALVLAHDGALTMLKHDQVGSGADLGMIVLELYETIPKHVTVETVDKALEIFNAFGTATPVRDTYIKGLLKWSGAMGGAPARGDPRIFEAWAAKLYAEGTLEQAQQKFLHGTKECSPMFAKLIREMGSDKKERDGILLKSVLQLLCLENMLTANSLLVAYMAGEDGTREEPSDALDFARYLLLTCERDATPLFKILLLKYKPIIDSVSGLDPYITKIGKSYFSVGEKPKRQQPAANPMESIMQSLMGGGGGGMPNMGGMDIGRMMQEIGGMGLGPLPQSRASSSRGPSSSQSSTTTKNKGKRPAAS